MEKSETAICSKCRDSFNVKNGRRAGIENYCGYCETVIFGSPYKEKISNPETEKTDSEELADGDFPPKISEQEFDELRKTRGAHIILQQ